MLGEGKYFRRCNTFVSELPLTSKNWSLTWSNVFLKAIFGYYMEMYPNMPNLGQKRREKNYFSRKTPKWHVSKMSNLSVEVQDLMVKYDKKFCANRFKCENKRKWPLIWNQWLILPKMAYFCENDEKRHLVNLVNLLSWVAENSPPRPIRTRYTL